MTRQNKKYSVESEKEYYKNSAIDRRAVPYEHLSKYFDGTVGRNFFTNKKVLDLGAGEGIYSAWIADIGRADNIVGIELTEHRIRRDYEKKLSNLSFLEGNILDMKSLDLTEEYDIVFMNLVLHHLMQDLDSTVSAIHGRLKKGGKFLAFEPNPYSPIAVLLHLYHDKSNNEGFLTPHRVKKVFMSLGFMKCQYGFFWRDRAWAKNPFLASSFWFFAEK